MPIIVVATPKGGAGKSTTSLVLGLALAQRGAAVTLVDADDNQPLVRWHSGKPRSVSVVPGCTESTFAPLLDKESATKDAVIVDLEGAATRIMSRAVMRADLVLIPVQPSALDAQQAGRMVALVRQEEHMIRRPIPFRVLMTRTNDAIPTKTTKSILSEMASAGIPALKTHLNERVAYKALFEESCSLYELNTSRINGVPQAIRNAEALTEEVTDLIKSLIKQRVAA